MNLMELLGFGEPGSIKLNESQLVRLAAWRDRARVDFDSVHTQQRYVVVDVEASGLDLGKDRLLAIGAVVVDRGLIASRQVFEVALADQGPIPDLLPANSLARRCEAIAPADALLAFLEFAGNSVLVAHRADFPRTLLAKSVRENFGFDFEQEWLDLAYILPGLFESGPDVVAPLARWQEHFTLSNPCPHNAVADAYVVARLMQRVIACAMEEGLVNPAGLREVEHMRRRVQRAF